MGLPNLLQVLPMLQDEGGMIEIAGIQRRVFRQQSLDTRAPLSIAGAQLPIRWRAVGRVRLAFRLVRFIHGAQFIVHGRSIRGNALRAPRAA